MADLDQLAAQIRVERHVTAIDELGIPRFRITSGTTARGFVTKPGRYTIYVGNSADNTPHPARLTTG